MTKPEFFASDSVSIDSDIIETIIGLNTKFKGSVKTDKIIRIDGEFEGDITSTAKVIVSETGKFKGDIKCTELVLDGHADGTAECSEVLRIAAIGVFTGEASTKNLIMVEGSILDGTLKMQSMRK